MNRPSIRDLFVFVLLIAVGVIARVALQDIPNFAPVAAIALFAGYFFGFRTIAFIVPVAIMMISDRLVDAGGYSTTLMLTVYGLLALPVLFQGPVRRYLSLDNSSVPQAFRSVLGLVGCSLACSLIFFLGTNFAVWTTSTWYEPTFGGLMTCFANAIPFFRYTMAGDAVFSVVLFGSYAAFTVLSRESNRSHSTLTTH